MKSSVLEFNVWGQLTRTDIMIALITSFKITRNQSFLNTDIDKGGCI